MTPPNLTKCATCGKPIEDKGADKAYCSELCYRNRSEGMERYTLQEVEDIIAKYKSMGNTLGILPHYAELMRENERLRTIIDVCECGAGEALEDNPSKQSLPEHQVQERPGIHQNDDGSKTFDYQTTTREPCKVTLEPGWDGAIIDGVLIVYPPNPSKT